MMGSQADGQEGDRKQDLSVSAFDKGFEISGEVVSTVDPAEDAPEEPIFRQGDKVLVSLSAPFTVSSGIWLAWTRPGLARGWRIEYRHTIKKRLSLPGRTLPDRLQQ